MKMRAKAFGVSLGIAGLALVSAGQVQGGDAEEAAEIALRNRYEAHIAGNEASANAWRSSESNEPVELDCDLGKVLWRRDRVTEFCASLCETDVDCGPEEGRCRVIDVENLAKVPDFPFVDDLPDAELDAWFEGISPDRPPVAVCDPFGDIGGATDADLIDTIP